MPSASTSTDAYTGAPLTWRTPMSAHLRSAGLANPLRKNASNFWPSQAWAARAYWSRFSLSELLLAASRGRPPAGPICWGLTRADLHQHVLGLQLARQGQARAHDLRRAVLHAAMRQTSRRDAFRVRHEALGACHLVEAQRIAHRLRLHKVGEFEIVFHVEPLPGQYNGNRRGQHEHVLVKTKRDIGHGEFLSSGDP